MSVRWRKGHFVSSSVPPGIAVKKHWQKRFFVPVPREHAVFWIPGELEHIPGYDVKIEQLTDNNKKWLWLGIKLVDPARAKAMAEWVKGPEYRAFKQVFGAELTLPESEYNEFIAAAKAHAAQQIQQEKSSA